MRNKAYSILLFAGILAILVPMGSAQGFSGAGSGTEQDPYIITNVYQLQEMNNDLDAWYELGNDIDASDTINWNTGKGFIPIGPSPWQQETAFSGHFDGKGHRITGLYISRSSTDYVGLFGCAYPGSEIKNIGLVDAHITGNSHTGGLVGINYVSVFNCHCAGTVNGENSTGGLVGWNCGNVSNSYSAGSVDGQFYVGGLVGENYEGTISNSYSAGSVSGGSTGGLVGWNNGTLTNSYSVGSTSGSIYTGGLVGWNNGGTCNNCFWDTQTSGQTTSAGGTGKTTAEMKQKATFTNWDFDTVWDIVEGKTYPYLKEVCPQPIASFTYSPSLEEFLSGQEITFIACEDETIISYEWSFKHGTTEIGTDEGPVVYHRFTGIPNGATDYTIILTVRDATGRVGTDEKVITVTHLKKKAEVVVDDILGTGLSRIGAKASYNWFNNENGEDVFKISRIDSWSNYFVGVYVVGVENDSGILWQKRLPAIPLGKTYYPEDLHVHASDWLRVTAYGVTEKEMLGIVSIASGLVGLPTMPPGDVPFFYGSDTLYFAPDYIDTSDFPVIDVEDTEILPFLMGRLCSPGELRVYDSQGRVTGSVNGEVKEEIPDSVYFNGNFVILSPSDPYRYEVVGINAGTYGLGVISVETEKTNGLAAADIPISPNAVHEYTTNWDALSQGKAGVTLLIDAEGDGLFERTIISDNKLTPCEIAIEPIGYELINQKKISETESEYIFRLVAKNTGKGDVKNITLKLASEPNGTSIIDSIVYFSTIQAGEQLLSDDTFTVRSDKGPDILVRDLVWQVCKCIERPKSDFSHDWMVSLADLAKFTDQWLNSCSEPNWCQGTDLDQSNLVNFIDFATFAQNWLWEIIPADFNIDGEVEFTDYAVFANQWRAGNCAESAWCDEADFNKSGSVDLFDLAEFAEHWLEGITP